MYKDFVYAKNMNILIIRGIVTKNHYVLSHTENLKILSEAKTNQVAM